MSDQPVTDSTPDTAARQIARQIEWRAVTGPVSCRCGHEHYGRVPTYNQALAPQWHYCENESCRCQGLRAVERETVTVPLDRHAR